MTRPSALHAAGRAAMVALLALIAWGTFTPRAPMPPFSPLGDQPVYTAADDARLPLIEPVLHAPWHEGTWVGTILAPVLVLGAGAGLTVVAGADTLATLFVLLALALDVSFAAALAHQSGLVVAVGLVWLAAGGAFSEPEHPGPRPWVRSLAAVLLWAAAVWWHWIAMAAWPVVLAGLRRRPNRPGRGLWTLASLAVGLTAFFAHFVWISDLAARQTFGSPALSWIDALTVAFDSRSRLPLGSFAAPDLTLRLSYLAVALAAVGLMFGTLARWWRRAVFFTAGSMAVVGLTWPEWQAETVRFGLWLLAPLCAVGLTWASKQATPRWRAVVIGALGTIMVAETAATGSRPIGDLGARQFRDALTRALDGIPGPLILVAEDTRLDSAVAAWMASRPDTARVAQDGAAVADALDAGRVVLAGPAARGQLLLTGIQFADAFVITDPAPMVMSQAREPFRCAVVRTDRWSLLPGVEYTGRLGIEIPPDVGGELTLIVGDGLPIAVRVETADGRLVPVSSDHLLSGPGSEAPPADYWLESGRPEDSPHIVSRLHLVAHPVRTILLSARLGRRAPRVLARLVGFDAGARGRVCAAPVSERVWFDAGQREQQVPLDEHDVYGRGWYGLEQQDGGQQARWTDTDAVILVRSAERMDTEVEIDAEPAADAAGDTDDTDSSDGAEGANGGQVKAAGGGDGRPVRAPPPPQRSEAARVTLRVNGIEIGTRWMRQSRSPYAWRVPAGAWLAGTNELWWHVSRSVRPADTGGTDTRTLGMRVWGVTLRRNEPASAAEAR